jgi:hypothetical protein
VWFMARAHREESARYNFQVMTVRRFTVLVTGLPQHRNATKHLGRLQIAAWFQAHFGSVVDVSIAYDDMVLVKKFKARGEIRRDMLAAQAQGEDDKYAKLARNLKELDSSMAFQRRWDQRRIQAAFVTFQMQESVAKCLAAFPTSWWRRCFLKRELLFAGHTLDVRRAAEPSNTLFYNLGLSQRDKWSRRAWTFLVSCCIMSVSIAAVAASQWYQSSKPSTTDCLTQPYLTVQQVENAPNHGTALYCYCAGLSTHDLLNQSNFCSDYIWRYTVSKGLIFIMATSTVLVNVILQVTMDYLARMEKHSSVTSEQRGISSRLFWGLFLNTGVIILWINANLTPYVGSTLGVVFPGKFSDLSQDWYYEVGVSILITMFLNTMNPHLRSLLAIPSERTYALDSGSVWSFLC